jgi:hypothetical protein
LAESRSIRPPHPALPQINRVAHKG